MGIGVFRWIYAFELLLLCPKKGQKLKVYFQNRRTTHEARRSDFIAFWVLGAVLLVAVVDIGVSSIGLAHQRSAFFLPVAVSRFLQHFCHFARAIGVL